jgi:hypothetical protein
MTPYPTAVTPAAAAAGNDDRNRIPVRIHNHRALSCPLYKTGWNALGTKRGGGSMRQCDRHTAAANRHDPVGPIEQRLKVDLAHASLLTAPAQMAKGPAIFPLWVLHRSASVALQRIPRGR